VGHREDAMDISMKMTRELPNESLVYVLSPSSMTSRSVGSRAKRRRSWCRLGSPIDSIRRSNKNTRCCATTLDYSCFRGFGYCCRDNRELGRITAKNGRLLVVRIVARQENPKSNEHANTDQQRYTDTPHPTRILVGTTTRFLQPRAIIGHRY